jgi:hypothetical protein
LIVISIAQKGGKLMGFGNIEYMDRLEAQNKRLEAVNKELLEALKSVVTAVTPARVVMIGGPVNEYKVRYGSSQYDPIKQAQEVIAKAEGKKEMS